jgi:predicted nucleotidyltransferase
MSTQDLFPGTPHHQELLQLITRFYTGDARILALVLFGSLGRGAGDAWSDLDLAVIVRDGVHIDVADELARLAALLAAQGDPVLLTADAGDTGFLIPQSLCGIAIDYTELAKVSSYVQHGSLMLGGTLDLETIRKAATANDVPPPAVGLLLQKALWLAMDADMCIRRHQFWQALPTLDRMRGALIEIYATSRGGKRASHDFGKTASAELQAKFGRTLPGYVPNSPAAALSALLDLVEHDLPDLSNGQLRLGRGERELIARLRARLAAP